MNFSLGSLPKILFGAGSLSDIGKLAEALVDAATIIIAAPTVLAGPHPHAVTAAYLANALRPKVKYAAISRPWKLRSNFTIRIVKKLKLFMYSRFRKTQQ